jgi:hypothetical protein
MKNARVGFAKYRTPMLAVMMTLGSLMLAQPSRAAACANGVYRAGCVGPNGAVGVRKHIHTVTAMGTTVRLIAPLARTERGVLDPMGLRSSAGRIRPNMPGLGIGRISWTPSFSGSRPLSTLTKGRPPLLPQIRRSTFPLPHRPSCLRKGSSR